MLAFHPDQIVATIICRSKDDICLVQQAPALSDLSLTEPDAVGSDRCDPLEPGLEALGEGRFQAGTELTFDLGARGIDRAA